MKLELGASAFFILSFNLAAAQTVNIWQHLAKPNALKCSSDPKRGSRAIGCHGMPATGAACWQPYENYDWTNLKVAKAEEKTLHGTLVQGEVLKVVECNPRFAPNKCYTNKILPGHLPAVVPGKFQKSKMPCPNQAPSSKFKTVKEAIKAWAKGPKLMKRAQIKKIPAKFLYLDGRVYEIADMKGFSGAIKPEQLSNPAVPDSFVIYKGDKFIKSRSDLTY